VTEPKFYSIEKLLSQSIQPFRDLPPDEFESLKQSINDRGILNPVLLTEDGYLYDGHQRLKAMIAIGRKNIAARDTRVQRGVTRKNMLEHAYTSNIVRRHLSSADKAAAMHQCVARGWSQTKIARVFGMSQPGVSQLLAAYPPEGELPDVIVTEGEDGKTYTRRKRKDNIRNDLTDITARDEVPTPYEYRQRIKKGLVAIAGKVSNLSTDAQMCGEFSTFAERDGVITAIDGIIATLTIVRDKFTAPGTDTVP
jgi:ParB-like chromosome segregation protein Spo0J